MGQRPHAAKRPSVTIELWLAGKSAHEPEGDDIYSVQKAERRIMTSSSKLSSAKRCFWLGLDPCLPSERVQQRFAYVHVLFHGIPDCGWYDQRRLLVRDPGDSKLSEWHVGLQRQQLKLTCKISRRLCLPRRYPSSFHDIFLFRKRKKKDHIQIELFGVREGHLAGWVLGGIFWFNGGSAVKGG